MENGLTESEGTSEEAFWSALEKRDSTTTGDFYYSVSTTGVYCLPTCSSRRPRRENVAFYRSTEEAEAAGYRPCKRCRPNEGPLALRRTAEVETLCRLIETSEEPPRLETLAKAIQASPSHTHRLFKTVTGVTPKQYANEHRRGQLRKELLNSPEVTEAIFNAGYGSLPGFYGTAKSTLGMKPTVFRAGGEGEQIRYSIRECSLGTLLVAATGRGICAISLGEAAQPLIDDLVQRFAAAETIEQGPEFDHLVDRVVRLVDDPTKTADLPLDIRGTVFQQRVWAELMRIPPGETATYSELATRLGVPSGARAVASACAANPLAVAVPCHRVLRQDGSLSGYRWGVERKRELLGREGRK